MKIVDSCKIAGLPNLVMEEEGGGFIVKLFKDIYTEDHCIIGSIKNKLLVFSIFKTFSCREKIRISRKYGEIFHIIKSFTTFVLSYSALRETVQA